MMAKDLAAASFLCLSRVSQCLAVPSASSARSLALLRGVEALCAHTSFRSTPRSPELTASRILLRGRRMRVLPVQSDTFPDPSLSWPLHPALPGGRWKSTDIIGTEPDSSWLFSTSRAAQRGTHFIPIKPLQSSQLYIMIFFFLTRSKACLPRAKRLAALCCVKSPRPYRKCPGRNVTSTTRHGVQLLPKDPRGGSIKVPLSLRENVRGLGGESGSCGVRMELRRNRQLRKRQTSSRH
ncbi:hypothetical protein DV515_00010369, partial [Chloebia gouldiae]